MRSMCKRVMTTARVVLFTILFMPQALFAQTFMGGNELYNALVDYERTPSTNVVIASTGFGYVVGVADAGNNVRHPLTGFHFCIPLGVTKGQIVDVARLYLERNPKVRHLTAHSILGAAFAEAFPCR